MSCLTGLDYKKLTDDDSYPLQALEPVLSSQNVLSISKLASRIPQKGGDVLTSSAVHATWLPKLFWQGDAQILKKPPQSDQDFLHAYDTCAKYLDRLMPIDVIYFLDSITFSHEATVQVSAVGVVGELSVGSAVCSIHFLEFLFTFFPVLIDPSQQEPIKSYPSTHL